MARLRSIALGLLLVTVPATVGAQAAAQLMTRARAIHRTTPMIDTHNDLPLMLWQGSSGDLDKFDPDKRLPDLDTDIPRIKAGMVGGQFWAAYVPASLADAGGAAYALDQIDIVHRMIRRSPSLSFAGTAADITRIHGQGKVASLIGIEGGYAIENSLGNLRMFHQLGVRYMTLTHASNTAWADAATDLPRHGGLSRFGEEVVREMNRVGMMVDISHVSDATMIDAIRVSDAPVIYSHSSARALADHVRNVPDSILALLPKNGGIVMVNFFPGFINRVAAKQAAEVLNKEREFKARYPDDARRASAEYLTWLENTMRNMEPGTLSEVADHVDHIVKVAGIDHVGYGADYGALTIHPKGLEDVTNFLDLTAELLRRGYTDAQVAKIVGGNFLRVMRQVEAVSTRLTRERPASVMKIAEASAPRP